MGQQAVGEEHETAGCREGKKRKRRWEKKDKGRRKTM